jgi:hypothetical protein
MCLPQQRKAIDSPTEQASGFDGFRSNHLDAMNFKVT